MTEFDLTVLSVARGISCLACESDWKSFYSPEKRELFLDDATCANFSLSAMPLFARLDNLKGALVEQLYAMAPAHGIPAGFLTDVIKFTPVCTILAMAEIKSPFLPENFDCSKWLCGQIGFVAGLSMVTGGPSAESPLRGVASGIMAKVLPALVSLMAPTSGDGPRRGGALIAPPVSTSFRAVGGFEAYALGCEGTSAGDCPKVEPFPPATGTPTPKPSTLVTATPKPKRYSAIGGIPGLVAIVAAATILTFVIALLATRKKPAREKDNTYASLN